MYILFCFLNQLLVFHNLFFFFDVLLKIKMCEKGVFGVGCFKKHYSQVKIFVFLVDFLLFSRSLLFACFLAADAFFIETIFFLAFSVAIVFSFLFSKEVWQ